MKTKSITFGFKSRALTVTLWEDLALCKVNKMNVLLGCEVAKNVRLNAMERVSTCLVAVGPVGFTYSRGYMRGSL